MFDWILDFTLMVEAHDPGNSPAKAVDGIQGGKLGRVVVLPRVVVVTDGVAPVLLSLGGTGWTVDLGCSSRVSIARQTGDEEAST